MAPKKDPEMENLKKELTGLAEKCREKQKVGIFFLCVDKTDSTVQIKLFRILHLACNAQSNMPPALITASN